MSGEKANINGGVAVFVEATFPTTELSFFSVKIFSGVNDCGFIVFLFRIENRLQSLILEEEENKYNL